VPSGIARADAPEKEEGKVGVIVLPKTQGPVKWAEVGLLSTCLQLETLLMEEAQRLWALQHGSWCLTTIRAAESPVAATCSSGGSACGLAQSA
jgi:hypothetical protein